MFSANLDKSIDLTLITKMVDSVVNAYRDKYTSGNTVNYAMAFLAPLRHVLVVQCVIREPDGTEHQRETEIDLVKTFQLQES